VPPYLGRLLTEADDGQVCAPVAVASHGFWQRQFGGSREVVGRIIDIGGVRTE
jgi:hypothetical protein